MAKYNKKKVAPVAATVTTTHQGGTGYRFKPELELMSLLANGISNTFYEKETEQDKRLANLIQEVGKNDAELVAKMLVYTRSVLGQRSVTHRGAIALMPLAQGKEWGKHLFTKRDRKDNFGGLVYRIDDMLEIAACYFALNPGKRLPNAMVKGFKHALENSDAYELAKYQGKDKSVSLVDLINLVHPKPSDKMKQTFHDLVHGDLKQFNTVEDKNTKAGQDIAKLVKSGEITKSEAEVKLKEAKQETFKELIEDKTIGYLALLRNLRNILLNASDNTLIKNTATSLTDEKAIKKSLVFPHQIDLALEVILEEFGAAKSSAIVKALNDAYELSIPNMSELGATGKTAVIYDESGSMTDPGLHIGSTKTIRGAIEKASLIAATIAKGLNADVYSFDTLCRERKYNPNDSIHTLKTLFSQAKGGGTHFGSIFPALKDRYDRIFIISDMQGADALTNMNDYKTKYNVDPYVYCINLNGYNTTMVKPSKKVFQIFGYSAEIYEIIKKYEVDYNVVLNEVKKINFVPKKKALKESLAS